jgi:hypothetical protein
MSNFDWLSLRIKCQGRHYARISLERHIDELNMNNIRLGQKPTMNWLNVKCLYVSHVYKKQLVGSRESTLRPYVYLIDFLTGISHC